MPTRAEKYICHKEWLVFVEQGTHAHVQKQLEKVCQASDQNIACVPKGKHVVELRWPHGVRYDNVKKFVMGKAGAEACDITVVPVAASSPSDSAVLASAEYSAAVVTADAPSSQSSVPGALGGCPPQCLPLKLASLLATAGRYVSVDDFLVDTSKRLGEGVFGKVFAGTQPSTGRDVAIKVLKHARSPWTSAMVEVSVYAAAQPHPNLLALLDVGKQQGHVCLVLELYHRSLSNIIADRQLHAKEIRHVTRSVATGIGHLHGLHILHNDLKPENVLVREGPPRPSGQSLSREYAQWQCQIPHSMQVCVCDLGNAVIGDSAHRPCLVDSVIVGEGVDEVTLNYRAPEILLGRTAYSYAVDVWALGCVAAEMVLRKRVFPGTSQIAVIIEIFRMFGKPDADKLKEIAGRVEPHFLKTTPSFRGEPWPPVWLGNESQRFTDFVKRALTMDPQHRVTAHDALRHAFFDWQRMNVVLSSQPAARGLGSMQSASLDQELTDWIMAEETWKEMASACLADKFKGGVQPGLKREEYGSRHPASVHKDQQA